MEKETLIQVYNYTYLDKHKHGGYSYYAVAFCTIRNIVLFFTTNYGTPYTIMIQSRSLLESKRACKLVQNPA